MCFRIFFQFPSQIKEKIDRSSFAENLNLEKTGDKLNSQNISFGIKGAALENSFGFRMNLENFQCAKINIEVGISYLT